MKKITCLGILLFAINNLIAQYTAIPDTNFEAYLETIITDDVSGDGQVPTSEIETLTSLDVRNLNITDLTGIEDFLALEALYFSDNNISTVDLSNLTALKTLWGLANNLTSIDLTNNTALTDIRIEQNDLTSLDLSNQTDLVILQANNNSLTSIDVSNSPLITRFRVYSNQITSIDLTNNTAVTEIQVQNNQLVSLNVQNGNNSNISTFVATENTSLTCILVDDAAYSATNWTSIDSQTSFSDVDCTQYTLIPDANFEAALEALGYDDIFGDGQVPTALIEGVTTLDLSNKSITDLTGIEDFIALTSLTVSENNIVEIDVSNNVNLVTLDCQFAGLSNLDVSTNTALQNLYASGNSISSIDLSNNTELIQLGMYDNDFSAIDLANNTKLTTIDFFQNQLTSIDVSNNLLLEDLLLEGNNLTSLDVSKNTALKNLTCNNNNLETLNIQNGTNTNINTFNATDNAALYCIQVDDASYSATNWTNIDAQTSFSDTYCSYTAIPDANFESALEALGYDDITGDGQVPTELIEGVTSLSLGAKSITDLTGIEDFTALEELYLSNNNLTSLDVSNNTNLRILNILTNENLASVDVSGATALETLTAGFNSFASIDFSSNTALTSLTLTFLDNLESVDVSNSPNLESIRITNNPTLSNLNVKNGANASITSFTVRSNDSLTCIFVDDPTYSTTNWTEIDSQTSFSDTYCNYTAIPDAIFEAALEGLGYDDISGDGQVPTALIEVVTSLDVSSLGVSDLTGIEDFTALVDLDAEINNLTTLDLSNNTLLETVDLDSNDLSALTLPTNGSLITFICNNNPNLNTLDFSGNTTLQTVQSTRNGLTTVNLSGLTALTTLSLNDNSLSTVDISSSTNLEILTIGENALTSLDLSNNTNLTYLATESNSLSSLDISNNTALEYLIFTNNNITSIDVSNHTALLWLYTGENLLTNIDVSNNTILQRLWVNDNQLTSLEVSNNTALEELVCYNNAITTLDASANTSLSWFQVNDNSLETVNLQNGNNTNISIFASNNNPNLTCMRVDDASYSATNWTIIDNTTSFSDTYCRYTAIPDANFEAALSSYDDIANDGQVPTENIEDITRLIVGGNDISDLTGIEDFVSLTDLSADSNNLSTIDLSNNVNLESINLKINSIVEIDLTNNTKLTQVYLDNNSLTSLNIDTNVNLEILSLTGNNITAMDFSNNTLLREIVLYDNSLTSIDISMLTALTAAFLDGNNIASLDLSNNALLEWLEMNDNSQLTTIDLSNLEVFLEFYCNNCTSLESVTIKNNPLLGLISIDNTKVSSLDFDDSSGLYTVSIRETNITSLDLSNQPTLDDFYATDGKLQELNLKSGGNTDIDNFDITGNPDLYCVLVDDAVYSTTNWTNVDAQTTFNDVSCDTAPTAICQNITVQLDETGNVTITAQDIDNGSTDDGTIVSMLIDIDTFDCTDIGDHSVTLTITDDGGNSDSCTATVTVEDNIAPEFETATLPNDVDVTFNNMNGDAYMLEDYTRDINYSDNCDINNRATTISQSPTAGTELSEGDHLITITVIDDQGNDAVHTFTITVAPTLGVEDITIQGLSVYPIPARDMVYFTIEIDKVSVVNLTGQVVKEKSNVSSIEVTELPAGIYFAQITKGNQQNVVRLVKK